MGIIIRIVQALGIACVLAITAHAQNLSPVSAYNAPQAASAQPSADEQDLLDRLNAERRAHGLPPLVWNVTLAAVCRERVADMAANHYFDYTSPQLGDLKYSLRRAGVSAAVTRSALFEYGSLAALVEKSREQNHPFYLEPDTDIGIGIDHVAASFLYRVMVIQARRLATLEPFPAVVDPDGRQKLRGELLGALTTPQVAVTLPSGQVREVKAVKEGERGFAATVAFDAGRGKYTVQVSAVGSEGPVITDVMYVYAGVPYPGPMDEGPRQWADEADPEKVMFEQLNRDRAQAGLAPMQLDARLSDVARAHSKDMAEHHFFAHHSPTTGDLMQRLAKVKLQFPRCAENIAMAGHAAEAEQGLMDSPHHRLNILTPEYDLAGIGIARDADGVLYATQVFAENYHTINPAGAARALRAAINQERRRRGQRALAGDGALDRIAAENSRAMQQADDPKTDKVRKLLQERHVSFRQAQVLRLVAGDAPTLAELHDFETALFGESTAIGIGIVQADSRTHGPKAVWTTLVVVKR